MHASDIVFERYLEVAEKIEAEYENYDGFVVIQGPSTITYTASMVSFMMENLKKTVVFTGRGRGMGEGLGGRSGDYMKI